MAQFSADDAKTAVKNFHTLENRLAVILATVQNAADNGQHGVYFGDLDPSRHDVCESLQSLGYKVHREGGNHYISWKD